MKFILLAATFFSSTIWAKDVLPENNFCSPIVDSKNYLTTNFDSYPRTVKFSCLYKCKVNGKTDTIKAISTITVRNMEDDATNVVCQGVMVKKVSWGFDFDKVVPFYAYKTELKEIKNWAFLNVDARNATETKYLNDLKKDLNQIAGSFIASGSAGTLGTQHFKEAGNELSAIANQLPGNTTLLDHYTARIAALKGQIKAESTAESLVLMMLKSSAAWRIPAH